MKTKQSKILIRIITFPIRALIKARDSYVKGMSGFAERGTYGGGFTPPLASSRSLKSGNASSSCSSYESEDMRELIRAASVRRLGGRLTEELNRRPAVVATAPTSGVVPRSCSVGMGKIDENSPCEFGEELEYLGLGVAKAEVLYPRSKSYAVAKRSSIMI